jgi:hypothetical protein
MKSATAGITTIGSDLRCSGINHATDIKPHDHKVHARLAEATQAIQTPPTTRPYPAIWTAEPHDLAAILAAMGGHIVIETCTF